MCCRSPARPTSAPANAASCWRRPKPSWTIRRGHPAAARQGQDRPAGEQGDQLLQDRQAFQHRIIHVLPQPRSDRRRGRPGRHLRAAHQPAEHVRPDGDVVLRYKGIADVERFSAPSAASSTRSPSATAWPTGCVPTCFYRCSPSTSKVEQFEGPPLRWGGRGDSGECWHFVASCSGWRDGGQVCEQAGESVHRVVVVGAFAEGGECVVGTCGAATGSVRLARTAGLSLS